MLILIRKMAIVCHRWTGVVFCLLFAWWFVSGIFMMYWDFPGISEADRLARSEAVDASRIRVSPSAAYATLKQERPPSTAQLVMFAGRPAYRFSGEGGRRGAQTLVYADDGTRQEQCADALALRVAAAWTGQPQTLARVQEMTDVDQWTIQGQLRTLRPLIKYSWPDGEQAYVSKRTCAVVQYTTRSSRTFAHLGAIPHWLYYTPLQKNGLLWTRIVIWSSGLATLAALLGLIVGISLYSPSKRYWVFGEPTGIPYKGQKRLHMIFGLFFGMVACTWAFSGMLSMDPFPATTAGETGGRSAGNRMLAALHSGRLQMGAFDAKPPREALAEVASQLRVKQLDFTWFVGDPVYLASEDPRHTRIIPVNGPAAEHFDSARIIQILKLASQPAGLAEARVLNEYDAYYEDRLGEKPLPVILARLNDKQQTRYYIDPRTARVVGSYNSRLWMTRWLYHGLHSLDFPLLYKHRPAWDVVVLSLLLGGTALCVTSVILAWQLMRRKLAPPSQRSRAAS
ncbi:MAG: PepSY domain-containing protein [Acidobacteriia bacterium]|nr:PepSY domain-containing protein [Terriglobia bacterium]